MSNVYYKYGFEYVESVLRTRKIWVSSIKDLNDPFEVMPISSKPNLEAIVKVLMQEHYVLKYYREEGKPAGYCNIAKFRKDYFNGLVPRARAVMSKFDVNKGKALKLFTDRFDRDFKLFCVSEINDSVLMWSHYCNCHKGVVIGYKMDSLPFSEVDPMYRLSAEYENDRAPCEIFYDNDNAFIEMMLMVARRKAKHWEYESEVRLLFLNSMHQVGKIDFGYDAVESVFFGVNIKADYKDGILKVLSDPGYSHVRKYQMRMCNEKYALIPEPV